MDAANENKIQIGAVFTKGFASLCAHAGWIFTVIILLVVGAVAGIGAFSLRSELTPANEADTKDTAALNNRLVWTNVKQCYVVTIVKPPFVKLTRVADCDTK